MFAKDLAIPNNKCQKDIARAKVIIEKSRDGRFYRTGIEIWAGFGPVGSTEKRVFSCFQGQNKILIHFSIRTKKLHNIKLSNIQKDS